MPKKKDKKGADKQDDNKKTPKKGTADTPGDKTASDDREKELYLIQIRYLNEQLEGYQLKCDQLEAEKQSLSSQHISLEKDKKDSVEYLKRTLREKEEKVDDLTERLVGQQEAADQDRDTLQLQISQLRKELLDQIKELTTENMTLAGRLDSLTEFRKQKEQLMSTVESMEKQLTSQEEEHKADIHSLEMKVLLEKRRLEKEMESHVAAIGADVQHRVNQKVPETTRLAIQENMELKAQMGQLSVHTHIVMEENSTLQQRKSTLSMDVENLEQMLKETSRQSCILKRVVQQLTEKCQQQQTELKERSHELKQLQTEHAGVQAEMQAHRQDQRSLTEQCSKNRAELGRLEAEKQEERKKRSRMESIMKEAAIMLREALMEASTELDSGTDSVVQWQQLMQKVLMVLESPKLNNCVAESDQLNELQTSDSAAIRAGILNPARSFQFEFARYRLGDLGIVPRPSPKHKHMISSSINKALHRKPSSQKTACSISPTDSAVESLPSRKTFTKLK
ncbi:cilia- and flagella-associated protein 157 [Labrus bergylta]|uniref:cilia- and flagella-associated protein 157 n=1 Tax=Labrus bergylta TaxID=56723 RepID=UPI0033130E51